MIFSQLKNTNIAVYPKAIQKALSWLKDNYHTLSLGEHLIEGRDMYAQMIECERQMMDKVFPESHQRYLDIHFICSGEDSVGFAFAKDVLEVRTPYDETRDVIFYNRLLEEQFFKMREGDFWIVFPNEIHRSTMAEARGAQLRKIVIKISMAYLLTKEGE